MGAISINVSAINSTVMPLYLKTTNQLKAAYSLATTLKNSLPNNFSNTSAVRNIVNSLYDSSTKLSNLKLKIENAVAKASSIDQKARSKSTSLAQAASTIGSVAGTITGAIKGFAVAGPVGAIAGGVAGHSVGSKILETGAKVVTKAVSGVKKLAKGIVNWLKKTGAKIADKIKSIWSKFSGTIKNLGSKIANTAKSIGKTIFDTGARIAKGIVNGVKNFIKGVGDGIKKVGSAIASKFKSAVSSIKKGISTAWNWLKDKAGKVKAWMKKTGAKIGKFFSKVGAAIGDFFKGALNLFKRVGATIANFVVSLVEGVVSFVESIGDLVIMVFGAVGSLSTGVIDIAKGIVSGDWSFNTTKSLWTKVVLPVVGYDWTSKVFDKVYETKLMQAIEKNAYEPFKRDGGAIYKIGKKVGYYIGVAVATALTMGAASGGSVMAHLGAKTAEIAGHTISRVAVNAAVTGLAKMGSATQENYNAKIDEKAAELATAELQRQGIESTDESLADMTEKMKSKVELEWKDVGNVVGTSVAQAGVEAAFAYAGGKLKNSIKAGKETTAGFFGNKGVFKGGGALAENAGIKETFIHGLKDARRAVATKFVSNGVSALKSFASEGIRAASAHDEYNWGVAATDALGSYIASMATDTVGELVNLGMGTGSNFLQGKWSGFANLVGKYSKDSIKGIDPYTEAIEGAETPTPVGQHIDWFQHVRKVTVDSEINYEKLTEKTRDKLFEKYVTDPTITDPISGWAEAA